MLQVPGITLKEKKIIKKTENTFLQRGKLLLKENNKQKQNLKSFQWLITIAHSV